MAQHGAQCQESPVIKKKKKKESLKNLTDDTLKMRKPPAWLTSFHGGMKTYNLF